MSPTASATSSGAERRKKRVVAILGGSSAFFPACAAALADAAPDLPPLELKLHGRRTGRAETIAGFCSRYAASRRVPQTFTAAATLDDALRGADVIVNQMRVGGFDGRNDDETLPLRFDLPGDETIGAGGLLAALRGHASTVHAGERARILAPEAWFVNMANPMSVLVRALVEVPGLRVFGLCELPEVTLARALALVGRRPDEVRSSYVGVNHQGFFHHLEDATGDLLPEVLSRLPEIGTEGFFQVDRAWARAAGALPLPYLRLYAHREREVARLRDREVSRARELDLISGTLMKDYAADREGRLPKALAARPQPWFRLALVPAIRALLGGPEATLFVSSRGTGSELGLPDDAVTERRAIVTRTGPRILAEPRPAPAELAAFVAEVARFELAAADAAREPSLARVSEALALHPWRLAAGTIDGLARAMLATLPGELVKN